MSPVIESLLGGLFTFSITSLGAILVLFFKKINKNILDIMLSLSAGIMFSSSFFSLLNPAIKMTNSWYLIVISFILGSLLILICDKIVRHNNTSSLKLSLILFISITLHNIPEGLVVGVAFASGNLKAALSLTLGIAIQNFPEGCAISFPLRRDGLSRLKAFIFGAMSAIVEPIFAVIGALIVLKVQAFLPLIMAFTAGAMIFVTVKELIPESLSNKKQSLITLFFILGFSIMMILEII